MIQGFPQEDSDSEQQEQGENAEEEEEAGYGGIKMASVGEIIAKARFNESYLHVNLGLGENLEELATHFGSEENGVCVCVCVRAQFQFWVQRLWLRRWSLHLQESWISVELMILKLIR